MSRPPPLFEWANAEARRVTRPSTHTNDPVTSHRAERKSRGRANAHRELVLQALRAHPDSTGTQLAARFRDHPEFSRDPHARLYQVRRRLSDLAADGLAERHAVKGSPEARWRLTP